MAFAIAQADPVLPTQVNHYRLRRFGDRFLVTTDHGSWVFLSKDELRCLETMNFEGNRELLQTLKDKGVIIDDTNLARTADEYKQRYGFLWQGTSLHIMVLTLRCNLKCVYCHAGVVGKDDPGVDMSIETAKKTVDFIFQSPAPVITIEFQGGEPTLNWETLKFVIEYAKKVNTVHNKTVNFDLVTNLTMMTDEKLAYLMEQDVGICTSLDGISIVHNKNRGKYADVTQWIEKINKAYEARGSQRRVNALLTVSKMSLPYAKEIVDEYARLGLQAIHLRHLNKLGFADKNWEHIGYSSEQFLDFWAQAIERIIEKGYDIIPRDMHILLSKILNKGDPNYTELRTPCGAVTGQITYHYTGEIFTCDEGRMVGDDTFKVGDVAKNTYKEVLQSPKTCAIINASINDGHICDSCAYKPYCGLCPVCNYKEQGSIIAKVPETSRCQVHMGQFTYIFEKLLNDAKSREKFMSWLD